MSLDIYQHPSPPGGKALPAMPDDALADYLRTSAKVCEAAFVGFSAEGPKAFAQILRGPLFDDSGRLVFYSLPEGGPEDTRTFWDPLHKAVRDWMSEAGIARQAVDSGGNDTPLSHILQAEGFDAVMPYVRQEWSSDGTPLDVPDVEGVTFDVYTGGDPDTTGQISELWTKSFRTHPLVPGLPPDYLAWAVRDRDTWYMLAREPSDGRIVGISEAGPGNFFSAIMVARSWWGSSLADALANATCNEFVTRGHTHLHSIVHNPNAASLRLHTRNGWKITGNSTIWASPVSG